MRLLPLILCSAALAAGCFSAPAAQTNAAPVRPRAVFEEFAGGRDPFFPMSSRRGRPVYQPSTNAPTMAAPTIALALKGISVTKPPLALINNTTVAEGEVADVRAGARLVKIRCREIRDASVLVEIVGSEQVQELKLREGI